jgi:hypothetical protein
VRLRTHPLPECRHDPGLADSGLAREQHDLSLAATGPLPTAPEDVDFLVAPHERRQRPHPRRLEPTRDRTKCIDPPDVERRVESPEHPRAKAGAIEQTARQRVRSIGDDDRVWFGDCL